MQNLVCVRRVQASCWTPPGPIAHSQDEKKIQENYKKMNTVNNVAKESSLSLMCGAHALNIVLIEKSGESLQMFKTLGFKNVHDSFR